MAYMLTAQARKIAAEWEKYKGTTIRPSKGLVRIMDGYARKLSKRKNPRLLVLGATPELRSIGAKYGYHVFAVDSSPVMLNAMGLLCSPKAKNETRVVSDWITMELPAGSFDLILADDSFNMLPLKKWEALLKKCSTLLRKDGLCVMQVMVEPPKDKLVSLAVVKERWKQGKIKSPADLTKYLVYTAHSRKTYRSSFQGYLKKLKKLKDRPHYASIWRLQKKYEKFNARPVHPPKALFERMAEKYFRIGSTHVTESDYCRYEPVYILRATRPSP